MDRWTRFSFVALLSVSTLATPAYARLGLQAGGSVDPDQFLVGARLRSNPVAESIFLIPSAELGFGDVFSVAGNLDGHYDLKTDSKYAPYFGGGITLTWYDWEGEGSDTEFGGSVLFGVQLNQKYYFETKYGLGDVADWKFLLGWGM